MIVPDLNLILHAYNSDARQHHAARAWWEELLSNDTPVGLPWGVSLGFLRLATSRAVMSNPFPVDEACSIVGSWLDRPQVTVLHPGSRHAELLFALLSDVGTAGNLTTDAHLAALAIENQSELHSNDADFARFKGLRWLNPLA
jgi:toxin-antitoxin system PIN domain toxin